MKTPFNNIYSDKKVLITGHTGFKGAWLSEWLLNMGADIVGISLAPNSEPSLFDQLGLEHRIKSHHIQDIRDRECVKSIMGSAQPDFVFHLAAQPLVLLSYQEPIETYEVNVMGTLNVLDALRDMQKPCANVFITTDKCYENKEWLHGYREVDPMGGHDPYSSSKGCAELAIASFRNSFFDVQSQIAVASVRAGNVIGGGDWAKDRIVPDCMRSLSESEPISVRNPEATRPWQHVLEPLSGYLRLGQLLYDDARQLNVRSGRRLRSAFNFGPRLESNQSVHSLVEEILLNWEGQWIDCSNPNTYHEASLLNLVTDKAFHLLNWHAVWDFKETVMRTVEWYRTALKGDENTMAKLTRKQIELYVNSADQNCLEWVHGN